MGTRLYPKTEKPEILDALCCVAPGTCEALQSIKLQERAEKNDINLVFEAAISVGADPDPIRDMYSEVDNRYYEIETATPDLATMSHFMLFGWGNVKAAAWEFLRSLGMGDDCYGEAEKPEHVRALLAGQRVSLPDGVKPEALEGLCWG